MPALPVAVVVPSPATSLVLVATDFTQLGARLQTDLPARFTCHRTLSLVTVGPPNLGPAPHAGRAAPVTRTVSASLHADLRRATRFRRGLDQLLTVPSTQG